MNELEEARRLRDEAFDRFVQYAALETKNGVKARSWRHRHLVLADEVRALERDYLSAPVATMYGKTISN